jgi:hypothetical protein
MKPESKFHFPRQLIVVPTLRITVGRVGGDVARGRALGLRGWSPGWSPQLSGENSGTDSVSCTPFAVPIRLSPRLLPIRLPNDPVHVPLPTDMLTCWLWGSLWRISLD